MNPCPCGYFNDRSRECHCTQPMIQRHMGKISGPLLDRIDIHIEVPAVNYKELRAGNEPERLSEDSRTGDASPGNPDAEVRVLTLAFILQCPDGPAAYPNVLRIVRRLRASLGTRHDSAWHDRPSHTTLTSRPPIDQSPLTCYKDWFCPGSPVASSASDRRPLRGKTSDAAKLNTPVKPCSGSVFGTPAMRSPALFIIVSGWCCSPGGSA
jgi:hypothetical protein